MLSSGRCAQDDYYLYPIAQDELPKKIIRRFERKIEDILPLKNNELLVFFKNGTIRKCNLTSYFKDHKNFSVLLKQPSYFSHVKIQIGGYGIEWDENLSISDDVLYKMGKSIPLHTDDFIIFATERIINASEAADILNCSRQYINELVKTGKLHPVKTSDKNTLFLKSEILKRTRQ